MRFTLPILLCSCFLVTGTAAAPGRRRLLSTAKVPKRAPNNEGDRRLKEKWIRVGDLKVKIEDGGVSVERQKMGKKRGKSTTVKFGVVSVQEVDANGASVGKNADEPHGVELSKKSRFDIVLEQFDVAILIGDEGSVAGRGGILNRTDTNYTVGNYTVADDDNNSTRRVLLDKNADKKMAKDTVDGGARGAKVVISSPVQTNSNIETQFMFVSGGGEVGTLNERWAVRPGDTKLNIALEGWTWCDPCADGTGAFLDVDIEIVGDKSPQHLLDATKGTKKTKTDKDQDQKTNDKNAAKKEKGDKDNADTRRLKKEKEPKVWDLGQGATLEFADDIEIDGVSVAMPEGYPKLITKRGKQMYTFRFPKFEERAWYDPVVTFDENYESAATFSSSLSRIIAFGAITLAYTLL